MPDAKRRGDPASKHFRLENSPFFLMNRTVAAYGLAMEQALRAVGTDIPRWRVLMLAHEFGPISVGRIADGAVIKLSTATKVVQRLHREGRDLQRSLSDARVTEVELTTRTQRSGGDP
jgi:DNA-binding MarR family transcriptional regulator